MSKFCRFRWRSKSWTSFSFSGALPLTMRRQWQPFRPPTHQTSSTVDLICSQILLTIDLQCHAFPFGKLLLNVVFVCKRQRHLHVTMLHCWAKFSNQSINQSIFISCVLVQWSIKIVLAKKYKTMSKFVKVMPRMLWLLFSGHGVYATQHCL